MCIRDRYHIVIAVFGSKFFDGDYYNGTSLGNLTFLAGTEIVRIIDPRSMLPFALPPYH